MWRKIEVQAVVMEPEDRMESVSLDLTDQEVGSRVSFDAYVLPLYFAQHLFLYVGDVRYQFVGQGYLFCACSAFLYFPVVMVIII